MTLLVAIVVAASVGAAGEGSMPQIVDDLFGHVDQEVVVEGSVSAVPWQHMIGSVPGKEPQYFDLEHGGQIVVYVAREFSCQGPTRLTGKVIAIEGGGKGHKSAERFTEQQLDVASWECLDAPVEEALRRLADPAVGEEAKRALEQEIVEAGKLAIPCLLRHLASRETAWQEEEVLNLGEMMNRPPNAPPVEPQVVETDVSVGKRAEAMLLRIITPTDYESPYAANFKPFSPGDWPFRVEDWKLWWARNQRKSLAEIREELEPVIDAYWQSHGVEQLVR